MESFINSFKKQKFNFILFFIKKYLVSSVFLLFTIFLVLFSRNNFIAAKDGLILWANNIVPSLLPFFIATELLSHTEIIYQLGKFLNPIMKPIFHVPGIGSFPLIIGIISGYPTGAKVVVNLFENNLLSKEETERLLAFTNNSGPLFILGTVGISMLGNSSIGFLLLFTHILASLTVGIIFRFYNFKNSFSDNTSKFPTFIVSKETANFSNLGEVLGKSIMTSIKTIVMIGGFVVLFSVILSILKQSNAIHILATLIFPIFKLFGIDNINFIYGLLSGFLEITNGISQISIIPCKQISINILLISFLLGFGGLSVFLQVYSIISNVGLSIKPYFIGKLLQGIIAFIYTLLIIQYCPLFNFNL